MRLGDLRRLLFAAPPQEVARIERSDPFAACLLLEGAVPIALAEPRTSVTVAGLVSKLEREEREGRGSLRVTLEDEAHDTLIAIWHGRCSIAGIFPGRALALTGTVGTSRGQRVMYDPSYTLIYGE